MFFAATDHGKSITNLAVSDVEIRDDSQPPGAILGFRNESQLPLRLGLVVDTSDSVKDRISFEQATATKFLQEVVGDKGDLAFVVGVNSSVFLVQDFTEDRTLSSRALNRTRTWRSNGSVGRGCLRSRQVGRPSRVPARCPDSGRDQRWRRQLERSSLSSKPLREPNTAKSLSTPSAPGMACQRSLAPFVGDHALRTLSELTGGSAFMPGSARHLNGSLADLQQVIRGRYLISYKPVSFHRDGRYRTIDIEAQKDGRKLKVFARKGYYASALPNRFDGPLKLLGRDLLPDVAHVPDRLRPVIRHEQRPSFASVTPTGRPHTSPSPVVKPVRKSSYSPVAWPSFMGRRITS